MTATLPEFDVLQLQDKCGLGPDGLFLIRVLATVLRLIIPRQEALTRMASSDV